MTDRGRRTPTGDVQRSLVDAAVTVLERDGYAALTVRTVAAEAGVAPMGIYNHLNGKDGLVAAVLVRGFDALTEAMNQAAALPPAQRLHACGHGYRAFARSRPATYALMFGGGVAAEVHEAIGDHAEAAFQALVDAVLATQQAGLVVPDDPFDVAMRIWSAVHGAMSLELAGSGPPNPDLAGTYERVLDMIEAGLAP
jgi:AcrR family transcriptional regulator